MFVCMRVWCVMCVSVCGDIYIQRRVVCDVRERVCVCGCLCACVCGV